MNDRKWRAIQSVECRPVVGVRVDDVDARAVRVEPCPDAPEGLALRGTFDPGYLFYTVGKLQIFKLRRDWEKQEGGKEASPPHLRPGTLASTRFKPKVSGTSSASAARPSVLSWRIPSDSA